MSNQSPPLNSQSQNQKESNSLKTTKNNNINIKPTPKQKENPIISDTSPYVFCPKCHKRFLYLSRHKIFVLTFL